MQPHKRTRESFTFATCVCPFNRMSCMCCFLIAVRSLLAAQRGTIMQRFLEAAEVPALRA